MEQTQIGIVSPVPMNDWNANATYYLLNIVRHNDAVYIARSASEGIEPGVTTGWEMYWLMLVKDGVSPQIQIDSVPTKNSLNPVSSGGTFYALDRKLDKITTTDGYNRAYGVSYEGNQMSFRVANSALASTLAQRDSNGNIKVGTPVEDGDVVPKSYVDGKLDKITTTSIYSKVYGIEKDGSQTSFIVATGTTIGGLPMWDGNGTLKTNAPVNNTDCVNKKYADAIKPILGGASDPDTATDAGFLGRLYVNEASGELFYAAQDITSGSYDWRHIASPEAIRQTSAPTGSTVGYVGQLCLVGSSDSSPYEVYICVYSDTANNQYVWHKMCTTEAPT